MQALQRPHCLSDPATRGELLLRTTAAIDALPQPAPCALVLGHRVSTTHRIDAVDVSFTPAALAEFRAWLGTRYRDLEALQRAWQATFPSFAEVVPLTAPVLAPGAEPRGGASLAPDASGGTQLGKRYVNAEGDLELLCTKPGKGSLACDGVALSIKGAKPLPASD